jgi:uncharacterized protein YabE (DUF348 family)
VERAFVHHALRACALIVVTFVAFAATWQIASGLGAGAPAAQEAAVAAADRSDLSARADLAARAGSPVRAADVLRPATAHTPLAGQMIVFGLGMPLTVVDGVTSVPLRVPLATTVDDALRLARVELGPLDRVKVLTRTDSPLASGDVIKVVRVTQADAVVREHVPFAVETVNDATLAAGRTVVATPGVAGVVENTYRLQLADGVLESRTLIATAQVAEPVAEVRRVGTKPLVPFTSAAPAEIERIIRDAAARWGANPDQLLRVAWCESRFNPNAYNPTAGDSGLFQFIPTTWAAWSPRAGYGGASVFDPVANANVAAFMFARGEARQWVCK